MMIRSLKFAAAAFAAVLTLTAGIPAAQAQTNLRELAKVSVPFGFEVGSQHFEPGVYTISKQNESILRVSGKDGAALLMANNESSIKTTESGKAVFEQVGGKFFLTQIWTVGSTDHLVSVKTSQYKRAQRIEEACLPMRHNAQPETTMTLALLR